jgi:cyanophycinase-like exopeptidase
MPSTLALIGGAEFLPGNEAIDRYLIDRSGGVAKTQGVIIPTAAARENPNLAARNGTRWFASLGITIQTAMIVDRASANDAAIIEQIEHSKLFYLLGGDPRYLLDVLRDSKSWDVIVRKYHSESAVIAGSSAGAMVLCKWLTDFRGGFVPALDLAPVPLAVAPHYSRLRALAPSPPDEARWLGIAEKTGAVFEGQDWVVIGPGQVTVAEPGGTMNSFTNGDRFRL